MQIPKAIDWDLTPAEAVKVQRDLESRVIEQGLPGKIGHVAGVDVGFEGKDNQISRAAVVVLEFPELTPVDYAIARTPVSFPYIPGLLAFREVPVILKALEKLKTKPDAILVDGHGRAHPRRMGIACHLGVLLDWPTIGCAKSLLVGRAAEPENAVGAFAPILDRGEEIGRAVRTRLGVTPIYVSIGHRVDLAGATDLVLRCCKGYRLPETTRYTHRVAGGEEIRLGGEQMRLV